MIDTKFIDDLAGRLSDTLPPGLRSAQQDLESNMRSILQSALASMNLVSREEFDVQQQVLARTRQKVEHLEKKLTEMEQAKQQAEQ